MRQYLLLLYLCVCFCSCVKEQTNQHQQITKQTDSVIIDDRHLSEWNDQAEEIADTKSMQKLFDSVQTAVCNSEKGSIPERIKAIEGFFTLSNCWSYYDVDKDSLIVDALTSLMMSKDIVRYDASKMFHSEIETAHSADNRLWNISWLADCSNHGMNMTGLICWRDKNNQPQGCSHLGRYNSIYKLHQNKNLYLLTSIADAKIVELTDQDLNLDYPAFKTADGYHSSISIEWPQYYIDFQTNTQELTICENSEGECIKQSVFQFDGKEFIKTFENDETD